MNEPPLLQPPAVGATPANMRQEIIDRIDEKPRVWSAYLEKAFGEYPPPMVEAGRMPILAPPDASALDFQAMAERWKENLEGFMKRYGFALLALTDGSFQFVRASTLAGYQWTPPPVADAGAPSKVVLRFNDETDKPEDLRSRILEAINAEPLATVFFVNAAFPDGSGAGGYAVEEVAAFGLANGVEMVGLADGLFKFRRRSDATGADSAPDTAAGLLEQLLREAARLNGLELPPVFFVTFGRLFAARDPFKLEKGLLENFWTGVELDVRTKKFSRRRIAHFQTLHFDATGEDLTSVSALSAIAKRRGLSVVMRRRDKELIFRRFFAPEGIETAERASGEARCSACEMILYDHPDDERAAAIRIDCEGRAWKV